MGFARRVTSWVGLLGGLAVASLLLPHLLPPDSATPSPSRFTLSAGILLAGAALGQLAGSFAREPVGLAGRSGEARAARLGRRAARRRGRRGAGHVDRAADDGRRPRLAGRERPAGRRRPRPSTPPSVSPPVSSTTSPSRSASDSCPGCSHSSIAHPTSEPPPANSPVTGAVAQRAIASTVKVVSQACGRIQSGTGFVVAPGVVVTNAHVVAGGRSTRVETTDRARQSATVIGFDPRADLAVLRAPGLTRPSLQAHRRATWRHRRRARLRWRGTAHRQPVQRRPTPPRRRTRHLRPGVGGPDGARAGSGLGARRFRGTDDRPRRARGGHRVRHRAGPADVGYAISTDQIRTILGKVDSRPVGTGPCLA